MSAVHLASQSAVEQNRKSCDGNSCVEPGASHGGGGTTVGPGIALSGTNRQPQMRNTSNSMNVSGLLVITLAWSEGSCCISARARERESTVQTALLFIMRTAPFKPFYLARHNGH
ncbi:hypothetical protein CIHG_07584 [Coccidioides immitis H538.4]|uniref:Uncharacterized protein n=2 Tax=Coccidioides immitis TaxID=5501 RepID=A0A0J8RYN7_COCIT|nr:hypothetical protein CIRG_07876 [Coccidioides immitis RMSCC 2394]KMU89902.1 hypothetical protein CIHG_07584 [Coccidioides immitis H538.4]